MQITSESDKEIGSSCFISLCRREIDERSLSLSLDGIRKRGTITVPPLIYKEIRADFIGKEKRVSPPTGGK